MKKQIISSFLLSNIEKLSRKYGIILIFSGKVYIVIYFFVSMKISYQILFGFTVEYVFVRKKFFMKKVSKYHSLAERRDK